MIKELKEEIVELVHGGDSLRLDGDLEEHYSENNTLEFRTRENGSVGDETPGEADIIEARGTKILLKDKYKDAVKVNWETVDEWVHLTVEIL